MKPLKLAAIWPEIGYGKRIVQETYKTESIRILAKRKSKFMMAQ
jgi:hypothetical protein